MTFWQGFLVLSLVASLFILWPVIFVQKKHRESLRGADVSDSTTEILSDHMEDLERTKNRGEIEDQEFEKLKKEFEQTLIEDNAPGDQVRPVISTFKSRLPVLLLVIGLPLATLWMYGFLGAKSDWEIYQLAIEPPTSREHAVEQSKSLMNKLQKRLKKQPENSNNWYLLGTVAVEVGDYDEAVRAYRQVLEDSPDAPQVLAEMAQALFLRAGNTITPEVRDYTTRSLELAPNMATALGLAGIDAFQSGLYKEAIDFWERAIVQLDPKSAAHQALSGGIQKSKAALVEAGETPSQPSSGAEESITVKVDVDKSLVEADASDAVFIYVRAWNGPKMPLAIQRTTMSSLPATVELKKSMSMMAGMDITSFPQLEVIARISKTGGAVATSGEWFASYGPVILDSLDGPVSLTINKQVP